MDIFQDLFPGCHLAITSMNNVISAGGPKQPFILDTSIISIHLSIFFLKLKGSTYFLYSCADP